MRKIIFLLLVINILLIPVTAYAQTSSKQTSTSFWYDLRTLVDQWLKQFQQIEPGGLHLKEAIFPTADLPTPTLVPSATPALPTEPVAQPTYTEPFPVETLPPGVKPSATPINNPTKEPKPTNIPEPTSKPSSKPAQFALDILGIAGNSCGWDSPKIRTKGLVCNGCANEPTASKYTRITCLSGKLNNQTYLRLKLSADGYTYLQCVGFARAVEEGTGGPLEGRDAKQYCAGSVPNGYQRITNGNQAKIGDLLVLTSGAWGHIMVVTDKGGSWFQVAEANWGTWGSIGNRMADPSSIDCVLRRN